MNEEFIRGMAAGMTLLCMLGWLSDIIADWRSSRSGGADDES